MSQVKKFDILFELWSSVEELEDIKKFDILLSISIIKSLLSLKVLIKFHAHALAFAHNLDLASASELASDLTRPLDLSSERAAALANALASELTLASASAHALDRALDLEYKIALTLDREFALTIDHDRVRALTHSLAFASDLASDLASTNVRALAISIDLARALASDSIDYKSISDIGYCLIYISTLNYLPSSQITQINEAYSQELLSTLDKLSNIFHDKIQPILRISEAVLWNELQQEHSLFFTLEGVDKITPDILAYQISLFIQGLAEAQKIYCELTNKTYSEPRIIQIHNEQPKIEIGVDVADTFRTLNDIVTPEKRKQDKRLGELEIEKREIEIKQARLLYEKEENNKVSDQKERNLKNNMLDEQYKQLQVETDIKMLEKEKLELEVMKEYFQIATDFIKIAKPQVSSDEMLEVVPKLAMAIRRMINSGLVPRYGWHDKPKTLPERSDTNNEEQ